LPDVFAAGLDAADFASADFEAPPFVPAVPRLEDVLPEAVDAFIDPESSGLLPIVFLAPLPAAVDLPADLPADFPGALAVGRLAGVAPIDRVVERPLVLAEPLRVDLPAVFNGVPPALPAPRLEVFRTDEVLLAVPAPGRPATAFFVAGVLAVDRPAVALRTADLPAVVFLLTVLLAAVLLPVALAGVFLVAVFLLAEAFFAAAFVAGVLFPAACLLVDLLAPDALLADLRGLVVAMRVSRRMSAAVPRPAFDSTVAMHAR
jgi:hypothetical protein